MTYTVLKGWHYALPLVPWMYFKRREFNWELKFDAECSYYIGGDQDDVNKLCGIKFLPRPDKFSARFGWRYNGEADRIEILSYCKDGSKQFQFELITHIKCGEKYRIRLQISDHHYLFTVMDYAGDILGLKTVYKKYSGTWGFRAQCYFGGNHAAPRNLKINLKAVSKNIPILGKT